MVSSHEPLAGIVAPIGSVTALAMTAAGAGRPTPIRHEVDALVAVNPAGMVSTNGAVSTASTADGLLRTMVATLATFTATVSGANDFARVGDVEPPAMVTAAPLLS